MGGSLPDIDEMAVWCAQGSVLGMTCWNCRFLVHASRSYKFHNENPTAIKDLFKTLPSQISDATIYFIFWR